MPPNRSINGLGAIFLFRRIKTHMINNNKPIIGDDGLPVMEYTERQLARFKVTSVFDASQTDGKPLPTLVQDLAGDVK